MKSRFILVSVLGLLSALASSTTVMEPSLSNEILNSESVVVSQILSGKCLLPGCKESSPTVRFKEYVIKCTGSIVGQCPKNTHFRSASQLKIGETYVQLFYPDKDGLPTIFQSLELQNDNKEVVFNWGAGGLPNTTLYKRTTRYKPATVSYYYRYSDFVAAVKSIKSDPKLNN